ncbi:uncharacterized protein LOC135366381 [Ornithodoros turicata]|uniref:uncharacterized protein LOC135366381 n=1 Tax=Ornithodoros turicata TaxID=34597 RepID=UPI0031390CFA
MCPSAEVTPKFYSKVVNIYKVTQELCSQINVREAPVSRTCEILCASRVDTVPTVRNLEATWLELTSCDLPHCVRDFMWEAGHGVLPTRDRLCRWGMIRNLACPNCSLPETNRHAVEQCVQVKTFFTLVRRTFGFRPMVSRQRRCRFQSLIVATALYVVWRSRCIALVQKRPYRLMYPMLIRLRKILYNHLDTKLHELGEHEFLKRWGTRYIAVKNGSRVQLRSRAI